MKASIRKLVFIAVTVFAAAAAFLLVMKNGSDTSIPANKASIQSTGLVMDANATEGGLVYHSKEEIQAELNRKVAEGMINISMNTAPMFPSGTEPGNLLIVNSEKNNFPQIVYIVRKDTGEEIYRSGGIPVGSKIEYAPLNVELQPGKYDCVAYFNNADPATGDILGTAGAEITITVGTKNE